MNNRSIPAIFLAGAATAWCLSQMAAFAWEDDGADAEQAEEGDARLQAQPQRPVGGAARVQARSTEQNVAASPVTETFHVQYAGVAQSWKKSQYETVSMGSSGAVVIVPAEGESHCAFYSLRAYVDVGYENYYEYYQSNTNDYPWTPRAWLALALTAQVSGKRLRVYDYDGDCVLGNSYSDYDSIMLSD